MRSKTLALSLFVSLAAAEAFASTVSPSIEGIYDLTVRCPPGAGATLCHLSGWAVPSLTVTTFGGQTYVGLADAAAGQVLYLFPVTIEGGVMTGGLVPGVPSKLTLALAADGTTLTGTLQDPSTIGAVSLVATPKLTVASCLRDAAPWATTPDVTGTYYGDSGKLVIQPALDGQGLTAAYVFGAPSPLYFQEVHVEADQAFTVTGKYPYGNGFVKWCLTSTDGHAWRGWSFGTNGYVTPHAFTK